MSSPPPDDPNLPPGPAGDVPAWEPTELLPRPPTVRGNALPTGSHLAEFELLRVLGEGGFGIVYLAHDHSLQRRVAIKEYMPASLAMRTAQLNVVVTSDKHRAVFNAGLESFVNEARLLAQFDHPSLVKVYRFWRANGTAYMVMPFYEGVTLRERLRQMDGPPDERWLMALLGALTEALAVIHDEHFLHRDIAPDNILLLADSGRPLLLDFGAARQVIGDATQALTAILKPGYAPVEQYAEIPSLKQGPWTDVYALCAVVYAALMGNKPPVSVARTVADSYVPLTQSAAGRYSPRFLSAIDSGLRVRPDERPPTVAALREALGLDDGATVRQHADAALQAAALPAAPPAMPGSAREAAAPATAERRAGGALWPLVVAGIGVLAAGGYWLSQRPAVPAPAPAVAQAPAPGPAPAAAPAAVTGPATPPIAPPAAPPVAPPATTPAATPAAPLAPFSVQAEFNRLQQASLPDFEVRASAQAPRLRIGRDRLGFTVSSGQDGHVYVLVGGPDGSLLLLYPNTAAQDNRIRKGQSLKLPQSNWPLDTSEPAGTERFAVLVSEHPRDFSHISQKRVAWFLDLPTGAAADTLRQAHTGPGSALAGKARCEAPGCDRYGVALFEVEVVR